MDSHPTRCTCGYKLVRGREIGRQNPPGCTNPVHPHPPACPECRDKGPHLILLDGTMKCRDCPTTFDPREVAGE